MTYQLSDLVAAVRTRAKDTTFDADLITDYLNETQAKVLNRSRFPFLEESVTGSVSAADTEYELPSDVDVIYSIKLQEPTQDYVYVPEYVNYADFWARWDAESDPGSGVPSQYTVFGNVVQFNCPLAANMDVKIKYLKTVTLLAADADVPVLPERYKEILLRGAWARVEEYRGNFDVAAVQEQKVEELAEDMLNRLNLRQLATNHRSRFGRGRTSNDPWSS